MNRFEKGIFLANLKNLDKYKNIKVTADIPPALQAEYKRLNRIAFEIRSEDQTTKTRINIKGSGLIIFTKKAGSKKWNEQEIEIY